MDDMNRMISRSSETESNLEDRVKMFFDLELKEPTL